MAGLSFARLAQGWALCRGDALTSQQTSRSCQGMPASCCLECVCFLTSGTGLSLGQLWTLQPNAQHPVTSAPSPGSPRPVTLSRAGPHGGAPGHLRLIRTLSMVLHREQAILPAHDKGDTGKLSPAGVGCGSSPTQKGFNWQDAWWYQWMWFGRATEPVFLNITK